MRMWRYITNVTTLILLGQNSQLIVIYYSFKIENNNNFDSNPVTNVITIFHRLFTMRSSHLITSHVW